MIRAISHVLAAVFNNPSDFNRRWNQNDSPPSGDGWPARWEGQWISATNGHHGALRCLLTQNTATDFSATFYAVYCHSLRVSYTVPLRGKKQDAQLMLEGDYDLGKLAGGNYHYSGHATIDEFRCTYECKYDRGTFELFPVKSIK
ncbi:MAG TPA: hypothetical protein VGO67_24270 [Verrucomicrobiae bacterium]|jgi:hypothetical protein